MTDPRKDLKINGLQVVVHSISDLSVHAVQGCMHLCNRVWIYSMCLYSVPCVLTNQILVNEVQHYIAQWSTVQCCKVSQVPMR